MPPLERLELRLQRRVRSYLSVNGALDALLDQRVELAIRAIETEAPDAEQQVDRAITLLKQGFL